MIILDAYPVIALLRGELAAAEVQDLIERDEPAQLTAIGLAEVLDYLVRRAGVDEEEAALDLAQLRLFAPPALQPEVAVRAGLLRARYYQRGVRALSLADCVAAETARFFDAHLATADPALLETCAIEGVSVIVLPDTSGNSWSSPLPRRRPE